VILVEGGVAEVLENAAVEAGVEESARLVDGAALDFVHRQLGAGRAGERRQVHHADEDLAHGWHPVRFQGAMTAP